MSASHQGSEFAGWLRRMIDERGLSLQDLAEECGVSSSALSLLARGKTQPGMETAVRLASAFNADVDGILRLAGYAWAAAGAQANGHTPSGLELMVREAQQKLPRRELTYIERLIRVMLAESDELDSNHNGRRPAGGDFKCEQNTDYGKRHNRQERVAALVGASA